MHSSVLFGSSFASLSLAGHVPTLAAVLVASVWQGLLLTLLVALSLRLFPGLPATARSAVWTAVLALVALLPVLLLCLSGAQSGSRPAILHVERTFSLAIVILWGLSSALRFLLLAGSAVRLHGILRRAIPVQAGKDLAPLLVAGSKPVRLCLSTDVDRPSVAGFLRPRILLPPDLLEELSEVNLGQIVLHEMEHLRRHDDWFNLLQQITLVLFPLNPALFWLNRRLSTERELACDDGVLRSTRARKAYAACLARVAESSLVRRGVSLALGLLGDWLGESFGGWRRRPELALRVERILGSPKQGMGRNQTRLAAGLVLGGLLGSSALLAHSPELVSFTPVPATTPMFARDQSSSTGSEWLAAARSAPGLSTPPQATLVKAIMPMRRPPVAVPLVARRAPHAQLRAAARSHARPRIAPWVVLTSWEPASPGVREMQTEFHLTPVVFESSSSESSDTQIWYTAVAYRGGWIVVQL